MSVDASAVERLLENRLVAIVRLDDHELAVAAAAVAIEAGVKTVELTFTIPRASAAIERLRSNYPTTLVGAGTIRQMSELEDAAAAGAQFLVAPGLNPLLIDAAGKLGLPMLPGVFTASEIDLALRLGVEVLKLFPAEPAGPRYLASLLQPFPQARLVPTGGVSTANAVAYLAAGAVAIAMGSSLFPARRIVADGPQVVEALVAEALSTLQSAD